MIHALDIAIVLGIALLYARIAWRLRRRTRRWDRLGRAFWFQFAVMAGAWAFLGVGPLLALVAPPWVLAGAVWVLRLLIVAVLVRTNLALNAEDRRIDEEEPDA